MVFSADLYGLALSTVHIQHLWWAFEGENVPEVLLNIQLSAKFYMQLWFIFLKTKLLEKGKKQEVLNAHLQEFICEITERFIFE